LPRVLAFLPGNLFALLIGYLLGSIPFGLLLTRIAGTQDLRSVGSGNIGATNVLRTGRKDLAAATLALDALKGTLAVLLGAHFFGAGAALAGGAGAFLGHLYPVWLSFRGGKGVATFLGCLVGVAWPAAIAFAAVWLTVAWLTRYSSAAALAASATAPLVLFALGDSSAGPLFALLAALLWIKHNANIRRLLAGSEGKIGQRA
jgi:glycerol-3-phosphate acyltransferase PlsY